MNRRSLAALLVYLALGSCESEQAATADPAEERIFSPRLVAVPTANQVRVEISTRPFSENNASAILRSVQVPWSLGKLQIDGLPLSGALYYRVSGLDGNMVPVWTSTGDVPESGQFASVQVGGSGGSAVVTGPAIAISLSQDGSSLVLNCPTTSGPFRPVWTLDGTTPTPAMSGGANLYWANGSQGTTTMTSGQNLSARCSDGLTWGDASSWNWEGNPGPLPSPLDQDGTILEKPVINAPLGIAGRVTFSYNPQRSRQDLTQMRIAYRISTAGATPGSYAVTDLSQGFEVTSQAYVEAFAMAWSAVSHQWLKGPKSTGTAGPPSLSGPGTDLPAPGISGPSQLGGVIQLTQPNLSGYQIATVKVAVWTSVDNTWVLKDLPSSIPANANMTIKAYLIGWNPSALQWQYGHDSTLSIPVASESDPQAIGEGTALANLKPVLTLPAASGGTATLDAPSSGFPLDIRSIKVVVQNGATWQVLSPPYQFLVSSGQTIHAYLIGWSTSERNWKAGPALTQSYPPSTPAIQPIFASGTSFASAPGVNTPPSFSQPVTFSVPAEVSSQFSELRIAYRTSAPDQVPSGAFTVVPTGGRIDATAALRIEALLLGWSPGLPDWQVGASTTVYFYGDQPWGNPDFTKAGGLDFEPPSIKPPTTGILPGLVTLDLGGIPASTVRNVKIAYKTSTMASWSVMDPANGFTLYSPDEVLAFTYGWSLVEHRWMYGKVNRLYIDPSQSTVSPPGFYDGLQNALGSEMEASGLSFTIDIRCPGATCYYTMDGTTPVVNTGTTQPWSAGKILSLPAGVTSDSLTIRAIAVQGTRSSPEKSLVVHLPRWTYGGAEEIGCISSGMGKVFACGGDQGPLMYQDDGWTTLIRGWTSGKTQVLLANDSEVVAGAGGEIWRVAKSNTIPVRLGEIDLGWVYGLARHQGYLMASTDSGTLIWMDTAWHHLNSLNLPMEAGPLGSDGEWLYQGSGEYIAKYGKFADVQAFDWRDWGTRSTRVVDFIADSFSLSLRRNPIMVAEGGLFQFDPGTAGNFGKSLQQVDVSGIKGTCWAKGGRLYMAHNHGGFGGIKRTSGWAVGWNPVAFGWPGASDRNPEGAMGVGIHQLATGERLVLASTTGGWYKVKLVYEGP